MDESTNSVSLEKIKVILSIASLAILTVQHFTCMFIDTVKISYLPLSITFFTYFINSIGIKKMNQIKYVSLSGTIYLALIGIILNTFNTYDIQFPISVEIIYRKIMFAILGGLSFWLDILYVKRLVDI